MVSIFQVGGIILYATSLPYQKCVIVYQHTDVMALCFKITSPSSFLFFTVPENVLALQFNLQEFLYHMLCFKSSQLYNCGTFCNTGYAGEDCSMTEDTMPVISSFRHGCKCNVRQFRCARVFVTATDIYRSESLTCRIQTASSQVDGKTDTVNILS